MKTKTMIFITMVVFFAANGLHATDINFYEDGELTGGDYEYVNVWQEAIVNVTGGNTLYFTSNDTSTVKYYNGNVFYNFDTYDSSILYVYGGSIDGISVHDNSNANIFGGIFDHLGCGDIGVLNLYGGDIERYISYPTSGSFLINVYGYNFEYNNGFLSGSWQDNTPFSIYIRNSPYPSPNLILHTIPEPSSILLLTIGCLLIKRKHS